ncbi:MAG: hypothetical protein R3F34_17010 [Planctomycetota bacterium]
MLVASSISDDVTTLLGAGDGTFVRRAFAAGNWVAVPSSVSTATGDSTPSSPTRSRTRSPCCSASATRWRPTFVATDLEPEPVHTSSTSTLTASIDVVYGELLRRQPVFIQASATDLRSRVDSTAGYGHTALVLADVDDDGELEAHSIT